MLWPRLHRRKRLGLGKGTQVDVIGMASERFGRRKGTQVDLFAGGWAR